MFAHNNEDFTIIYLRKKLSGDSITVANSINVTAALAAQSYAISGSQARLLQASEQIVITVNGTIKTFDENDFENLPRVGQSQPIGNNNAVKIESNNEDYYFNYDSNGNWVVGSSTVGNINVTIRILTTSFDYEDWTYEINNFSSNTSRTWDFNHGDYIALGLNKPFDGVYIQLKQPISKQEIDIDYVDKPLRTLLSTDGTSNYSDRLLDDVTLGLHRSGFVRWEISSFEMTDGNVNGILHFRKTDSAHSYNSIPISGFSTKDLRLEGDRSKKYWVLLGNRNIVDPINGPMTGQAIVQGINILFTNDKTLQKEIPNILSDQYLPDGETNFASIHESARDDIVQDLRNLGYTKFNELENKKEFIDHWDLVKIYEVEQASLYLTLSKIMFLNSNKGDDIYFTKGQMYAAKFREQMSSKNLSIDLNNNGIIDQEESVLAIEPIRLEY